MQDYSSTNGCMQQQVPLDYTLQQQQPLPPPFYPFPGLNYAGPMKHSPQHQALEENHRMRMLQYYRHVSAAAFNYPQQNVEHFVAEKPVESCSKPNRPVKDSGTKPEPNFQQFTIQDIASHFDVHISKSIIEEAEVLLQSGRSINAKKVAKSLLLAIIGEEVIITQTAYGGRTYKPADLKILQAVRAIVNSRLNDRKSNVDIVKVFNTLSEALRSKRRQQIKRKGSASVAKPVSLPKPMPFSPATSSSNDSASPQLTYPNQYNPQPQQFAPSHYQPQQQHSYPWPQPPSCRMTFLPPQEQLPSFAASRFYSPATQSMPYSSPGLLMPQPEQQQQPHFPWNYQQQHQQPYEGLAASLSSHHSISPHSADPGSSEMSSPTKTDSPYEGNLEICEDEPLEDEDELVGALQATSPPKSQPFSQEFWDYQAQQDYNDS